MISLLTAAARRAARDFELVFSLDDQPRWNAVDYNSPSSPKHPGFGAVRCRRSGALPLPFFGSHAIWSFENHEETFGGPPSKADFLRKQPTAVFRGRIGGCSGDWHEMDRGQSFYWLFNHNRTMPCGRALVASLARAMPDKIDYNRTEFLTLKQQSDRFRYVLSVEGYAGWAERLSSLFSAGMLLFNQDHQCAQWFEPLARPYEHFVPVRNDLADLIDRIEWANEHPNIAYSIVGNAMEFANRHLSRAGVLDYVTVLLDEYSQRLAYRPEIRNGSVLADVFLSSIDAAPRSIRAACRTNE